MNDLGPVLLVLAAQITVPVVGGLLLSRRRDPAAACDPLVLAAVAVLFLTPLAFAPRPTWPKLSPPAPESHAAGPTEEAAVTAAAPGGIDVLKLLRLAEPVPAADAPAPFDLGRLVALGVLGLGGLGLARLGLGVQSTARVVRRGRPVTDPGLLDLARELRAAVGCRRPVELRESPRVGSAATAGWFRPVVLVSPLWRLWTPAERRAVLAHELAHVARGDFVTRLVARLAVALHGYHPLVRWLAARLELRQEMAADARAAAACDGRPAYLRCLAGLALKADARPLGPLPTFLSRPRTLFRRIAMLRVTDDTAPPHPCLPRRWPAAAVILLAAAALGLHGTRPQALAGPVAPVRFAEKTDRPPLDAAFIIPSESADEVGVFALRVGELMRTPGMEKAGEMYAGLLTTAMEGKKTHFALADIEQVSGRVTLTHDPKKPAPNRSLSMSLTMVRMERDFDWPKQLRDWCTAWAEHTHAGTRYYSGKITVPVLGFKDQPIWCYLPDARTAVLESEANIKALIDRKGKPAAPPWAADWKPVEGGTLALVVPDVKGKLAPKLTAERPESELAAAMMKPLGVLGAKAGRAAVGIDLDAGCSITVRLACATAADAAAVGEGCQAITKLFKAALDDDEPTDPVDKAGKKLSTQLVNGIEFGKTVDHVVEVRLKADGAVTEVLKALGAAGQ
jgi:hypothetical protein